MKKLYAIGMLLALGAGCISAEEASFPVESEAREGGVVELPAAELAENEPTEESGIVLPMNDYASLRTYKSFGEYIDDRFTGYHVADDIEVKDTGEEIPVYAIASGTVTYAGHSNGYGGLIIVAHDIDGETISAIYGHVDMSSASVDVGDAVEAGALLANLGDHESEETDGARKHLHFGLYEGSQVKFPGYVGTAQETFDWINPHDFFLAHGVDVHSPERIYSPSSDVGGDVFNIAFAIPEDWEIEYVPQIQAINLYTLSGEGPARERSQVFIRYFDASSFLTLSTVTIHKTEDLTIGTESYTARRYDIEKKSGVADFEYQPSWRNARHIVTDFRAEDGFARYYVVAGSPELDSETYERILESMEVLK